MVETTNGGPELPAAHAVTHRWLNTLIALLAALTAIASAVAHHYTVEVRPEVCPAVRSSPAPVEMNPLESLLGPSR